MKQVFTKSVITNYHFINIINRVFSVEMKIIDYFLFILTINTTIISQCKD